MEPQSTEQQQPPPSSMALYDFLDWLDKHRKQVINAVVAVAVIGSLIALYLWWKGEKEQKATQQLFALGAPIHARSQSPQDPQKFLSFSRENSGTGAGERAALIGASLLFTQGKYAEAQAQFEQFLKQSGDSDFAAQGTYGLAVSLDAQGKFQDAVTRYQEVISRYPTENVAMQAKLNLGRIHESQNRPQEALRVYESISSPNPGDVWASQASEKIEQLLTRHPELAKPAAPTGNVSTPGLTNQTPLLTK